MDNKMMQRSEPQRTRIQQYIPPISIDTKYLLESLERLAQNVSSQAAKTGETMGLINDKWTEQLVTLHTYKYVDINSSHRNRNQYPLASNFVIPYTNASPGSNAFNSYDPVTSAFPYESGLTQAGSTTTTIVLASTSSTLNNFYVNSVLDISGQYAQISNYVGATQTATITPALAVAPPVGTSYQIRRGKPIDKGTLQAGSTQTTVVLPLTSSSLDDYYVGNFILFDNGPASGQVKLIVSYNGTTKVATLSTPLTIAPSTDLFEIDGFSYDNMTPLRYSGSRGLSQPVCYAIQLLQLTIPNQTLKVGYGGKISNYPYLYIHFYNDIKHTETIIYGNNPAATLATFRVGINVTTAGAVNLPSPNFFVFDNNNLTAPEIMKFSPSESIRFRVTLPNGEDLQFIESDTASPAPVNPIVQISALIGLKRMVIPPKVDNVTY